MQAHGAPSTARSAHKLSAICVLICKQSCSIPQERNFSTLLVCSQCWRDKVGCQSRGFTCAMLQYRQPVGYRKSTVACLSQQPPRCGVETEL
jgi:hypothetical protein